MTHITIKNANQVGILVNNVGILGPGMLPFLELDLAIVKVTHSEKKKINLSLISSLKDMVTVNITAATYLCPQVSCRFTPFKDSNGNPTHTQLLPTMVAKGKGAVINIASTGSYGPGPYLAEYIATKHYMHSFTEVNWPPFFLLTFYNLVVSCLGDGGHRGVGPRNRSRRC